MPATVLVELTLERVEAAVRRRFAGFCEHLDPDLDWTSASATILEELMQPGVAPEPAEDTDG